MKTHSHTTGESESDSTHSHAEKEDLRSRITHIYQPHTHDHSQAALDQALATERGIRVVKITLAMLIATALFQMAVVALSGSVALLADTLHNFSDALSSIPLWLAFILAKRARNRRFTYGYGRAEDLAGMLIVVMLFGSALLVFYESIQKMLNPQPVSNLGWVAAAALIGFFGNELVAWFRIRVGRQIGSAALVADGMHARTDGLTSLGVLVGAIGVWLGFPLADPLIGFIIGVTILGIVWGVGREMWFRIMDATDPALSEQIENLARSIEGVMDVHNIALRWLGHRQLSEMHITVDCQLSTYESHRIAEHVRQALFQKIPAMVDVAVHVDPCECDETVDYHLTPHHRN
jgi:cation diffusion facilitator family transporter